MTKDIKNVFTVVDLMDCELIDHDPVDDETDVPLTGIYELKGNSEDIIEIVQDCFEDDDPMWTIDTLADEIKLGDIVVYMGSRMTVDCIDKYPESDGTFLLSVMMVSE